MFALKYLKTFKARRIILVRPIVEAGEKTVAKMQEQIDAERQARENAKKEESLMDKQSKLAQLRRDTSGSNSLEIQKLEKELADEQQAYQDTLVDQAVDRLAKQNEKAAEQRQMQIDLMQAQLDYWEEFESAREAERILNESLNNNKTPFSQTVAGQLIANNEGIKGMTEAQKKDYLATLDQTGNLAAYYHLEAENTNTILRNIGQAIAAGLKVDADFTGIGVTKGEQGQSLVVDNPYAKNTTGDKKSVSAGGTAYDEIGEKLEEPALNWWTEFWTVTVPEWWGKVTEWFGKFYDNVIYPIWIVIKKFFELIWHWIEPIWNYLNENVFKPVGEFFAKVGKVIGEVWNKIWGVLKKIGAIFSDIWGWAQEKIFQPLWDGVVEFFSGIVTWIKENAGLPAEEFFSGLWGKITEGLSNFWEKLKEIWNNLVEGVKTAWDKVVNFFKSLWDQVVQVWQNAKSWFSEHIIQPIIDVFKNLYDSVIGFFVDLWNGIKETWDKVASWFDRNVIQPVKDAFNNLGNFIKRVWNGVLKAAETVVNFFVKGINKIFEGINNLEIKIGDWEWSPGLRLLEEVHWAMPQYKTGGMASFTGPAWLDGTPSKPELVLNQQDTQNFLALKDVLSDVISKGGLDKDGTGTGSGDNYFEIEINVDSIGDDYDVEQMAEKIKAIIYDDSMYRNVNAINQIR